MESELPPTATPEQLKECCENCKVVLSERVSHFCEGGKGLQGTVSTWASRASWGQIEANGTASDEEKNVPRGKRNHPKSMLFPRQGTLKENARFKKRQDRRKARKLDSNSSPSKVSSPSSDDSSPSNDSSPSSARKSDDSPSSARKSDGSSAPRGGGRGGGRRGGRRSGRGGGRRSGRASSDQNSEDFAKAFSHIPDELIARADASRIRVPAGFDSGDGLQGFVHGPNQCASGKHCQCPGGDVRKSTHKCFGCKKPLHSSVCAKWHVEGGKMWCVFCKKPNPEPQDLMENKELRDHCQRVGMG